MPASLFLVSKNADEFVYFVCLFWISFCFSTLSGDLVLLLLRAAGRKGQANHFGFEICIMIFESWGSKFGMVVLHDNAKSSGPPFKIYIFVLLRRDFTRFFFFFLGNFDLDRHTKKKKSTNPNPDRFHIAMKNNHANFCFPALKNHGAKMSFCVKIFFPIQ